MSSTRPAKDAPAAVSEPPVSPALRFLRRWLSTPVDGASLAAFRIAVGLVMALEAYTLTQPIGSVAGGLTQLQNYYTGPDAQLHFAYPGFGWLPLLSPGWLKLLVFVMGAAGLSMAAGLFYRASAAAVFLIWGYFYAVESTRTYWMSYYYLELLLTFLMIWIPAGRAYSLDARRKHGPKAPDLIPFWPLALLRGQLVITYFYAGVAKLNADWLLDAMPVRYFLAQPHVASRLDRFLPSLKPLLYDPSVAFAISYAGAVFDLLIGFLLLIRRTRILGLVLMLIFHGTNHFLLFNDIVWFPLVGVLTALIFLEPDWPRRVLDWLKKPRLRKPDWPWFGAGAIGVPVVGATLGWSFPPTEAKASPAQPLARWVPPFVIAWLSWQALFPARHFLIPGDARMTFEGLAFSWRLKAELYRANPAEITLSDPQIVRRNPAGQTEIDWTEWKGERVLYRGIDLKTLRWHDLPELVALFEPKLGERVIYNPFSGTAAVRGEAEARRRAQELWRELYGHPPQSLHRTVPFAEILDAFAAAVRAKGGSPPQNQAELADLLLLGHGREGDRQMLPFLRRIHPFGLKPQPVPPGPFLVIEDAAVFNPPQSLQIDRARWKAPPETNLVHFGASALVIRAVIDPETRGSLPQIAIVELPSDPLPAISWDYRQQLSLSKQMHIGIQPFLLRDYARRIAEEWQQQYGRRPAVHAHTSLSLNLRPPQEFVDPGADLAGVSRKYLRHNSWIRDLELPRIPREALENAFRQP